MIALSSGNYSCVVRNGVVLQSKPVFVNSKFHGVSEFYISIGSDQSLRTSLKVLHALEFRIRLFIQDGAYSQGYIHAKSGRSLTFCVRT